MTDEQNIVVDDDIMITMRAVSDSIGLPYTVNPMELVDREAVIELREGPAGPPGAEGDPAWPWRWQGDVADLAALYAVQPTVADARKAWRVVSENAVYLWTGLEFIAFEEAFGQAGKPGAANALTGAAVTGAADSSATARITGNSPGQRLEITFPQGETGEPGDPGGVGRLQDAADVLVDADHQLGRDFILTWSSTEGKFVPAPSPRPQGPWVIGESQFSGGSNLTEPKTIAAITVPGQPTAWRPRVVGSVRVSAGTGSRADLEVRIGGPDGALVGYGVGLDISNWTWTLIGPRFSFPMTPDSDLGVVAPNQTITLYVIAKRVAGSNSFKVVTTDAQLMVFAEHV
ncbi:hypothetical protein [Nocardia sp. CNY236]|uniref:hypothetical protein n=1 Tax=Nocardia sp. CNY236 TaxID=1169152 RepID=UPI0003FA4C7C|nr:hypothetical protein [Nocardia sp. CNY236]